MGLGQFVKSNFLSLSGGFMGTKIFKNAVADTPNAAAQGLFRITNGHLIVTFIMAIRTIIQGGAASNIRFTVLTAGPVTTNISAATATTATDPVGTVYSLTGNFTDNVLIGAGPAAGGVNINLPILAGMAGGISTAEQYQKGMVLGGCDINVTWSAANATGSCRYVMCYIPIDPAVTVVAL